MCHSSEMFFRGANQTPNSLDKRLPGFWWLMIGRYAVHCLFTLSGFLMSSKLYPSFLNNAASLRSSSSSASLLRGYFPSGYHHFLVRRWFRLAPCVLVTVICMCLLPGPMQKSCREQGWAEASLLKDVFESLARRPYSCSGQLWSVTVEWEAAILCPLLLWLLARRPRIGWCVVISFLLLTQAVAIGHALELPCSFEPSPSLLASLFSSEEGKKEHCNRIGYGVWKPISSYRFPVLGNLGPHVIGMLFGALYTHGHNKPRRFHESPDLEMQPYRTDHHKEQQQQSEGSKKDSSSRQTGQQYQCGLVLRAAGWLGLLLSLVAFEHWFAQDWAEFHPKKASALPRQDGSLSLRDDVWPAMRESSGGLLAALWTLALLVMCLVYPQDWPARALSARIFYPLGLVAYSAYLMHTVGPAAIYSTEVGRSAFWLFMPWAVCLTYGLATLMYIFIEHPAAQGYKYICSQL